MKKLYTTLSFLALGLALNAQVDRVPMFEIFSSSTCPPCKPASDIYNPLLEQFHDQVAVVKYPMSWPGAGDPYYLPEFDVRKNFYSVGGVPNLFMNGEEVSSGALNAAYFESKLEDITYMDLELKYYVDKDEMMVYWSVNFEALDNYFEEGEYMMFWSINEIETHDNATTNGETEFHHIAKKLLPDYEGSLGFSLGDSVWSGDKVDTIGTFQFVGDYRLPSGANDAVDLSVENSIEETTDLEMMLWVNNMNSLEVIQAAIGKEMNSIEKVGDFGGGGEEPKEDPTDPRTWPIGLNELTDISFNIYPNPVKDLLNIKLSESTDFTVIMTDLLGKQVMAETYTSSNFKAINVADMPEGVYMIQVKTDN